jgi:hypothetical protein
VDKGIVVTSHASQGKTVAQVIVTASIESFTQANEAQSYVPMSRARKAIQPLHRFKGSPARGGETQKRRAFAPGNWSRTATVITRKNSHRKALTARVSSQRAAIARRANSASSTALSTFAQIPRQLQVVDASQSRGVPPAQVVQQTCASDRAW